MKIAIVAVYIPKTLKNLTDKLILNSFIQTLNKRMLYYMTYGYVFYKLYNISRKFKNVWDTAKHILLPLTPYVVGGSKLDVIDDNWIIIEDDEFHV